MVDIEVHDYFSILWQIPTNIIIIVIIMVIIIIKIITCAVALETQYHISLFNLTRIIPGCEAKHFDHNFFSFFLLWW